MHARHSFARRPKTPTPLGCPDTDVGATTEGKATLVAMAPRTITILLALVAGIGAQSASAAPGDLDATFGTGGSVITPVSAALYGYAVVAAVQPDGKIVVAIDSETTNADLAVLRYDSTGTLDPTWGTAGVATLATSPFDEAAVGIAVQPDGKVLVAGASSVDIKIARLDSSGTLDATWGSGGIASTNLDGGGLDGFGDFELLPDGRVLVGGSFLGDLAMSRFESDGTLDVTFGGNGIVTTDVGANATLARVAVQPDSKILATGHADGEIVTARYYSTGVLDPSFGTGGVATTSGGTGLDDVSRDILVEPDGRIVVLAQDGITFSLAPTLWMVIRYESDGTLDTTWGGTGIVTTAVPVATASSNARALVRQSDGKIIASGDALADPVMSLDVDVATVRYDSDGTLDPTWGGTGIVVDDFGSSLEAGTSVQLQPDAKLIVAGGHASTGSVLVARYEVGEYCGDGTIQGGESCDDGNGEDGDCCSSTCTFESFGSACDDEGDACTADACDGAGTCVHTPLSDGASCEDGNACTQGETCSAGTCSGGVASGIGCVNPFVCYKSSKSKGAAKFPGASNVSLADDLESGSFDVKNQFEVCVPAEVNEIEVLDPNIRHLAYKIRPSKGEPKHVKQTGIVVTDHFGTRSFDTKKAELLLAPAHLSLTTPPSPPAANVADHFKCYKIKLTNGQLAFPRSHVTAADEFEDRFYDVYSPRRLCYPVDKDGQGINDTGNVITCYRLRRSHLQPLHDPIRSLIQTADSFGDFEIDTKKERDICLPGTIQP